MATPASTSLSTLVGARETTWGTLPGSPKKYQFQFNSSSMSASQGSAENTSISGDRNPRDSVLLRKDASGEIAIYAGLKSAAWWFEKTFGGIATVGSADPYAHTFKVAATLPSFQLEEKFALDTPHYLLYKGCRVNTFSMSGGPDGIKEFRYGVMAKDGTPSASQTLATATDWTLEDIIDDMKALAVDVKFNGSAYAELAGFDMSFSNNLNGDDYRMGQVGVRSSLQAKRATLTGSIRAVFESLTAYNLAVAGTYTSLDIKWTLLTHSIQMFLPRILLERKDPQISGDGFVYLDLPFKASKDGTELSCVTATVTNDVPGTDLA